MKAEQALHEQAAGLGCLDFILDLQAHKSSPKSGTRDFFAKIGLSYRLGHATTQDH
jgi:hypothetical protein